MPIVELHENPYTGEVDIYRYNYLPKPLKVHIFRLMQEFSDLRLGSKNINRYVVDVMCNEYGAFSLEELDIYSVDESKEAPNTLVLYRQTDLGYRDPHEELKSFFLRHKRIKHDLNAIKLAFDFMHKCLHAHQARYIAPGRISLAIEELNARFKQHGIGYEFNNNNFLRVDSQFVHSEIVKPALILL